MNIFFISDTHFSHGAILGFKTQAGEPVRSFATVEEMDETMVERWNRTVKPSDHIYHLGDVAMRKDALEGIMPRLNGHKRLVRGNHDIFRTRTYLQWFDEIYGVRVLHDICFTHIPLHPGSVNKRWLANVHGHIHNNEPQGSLGPRYYNVSVEMIDYTPVALEDLVQRVKAQQ